VLIPLRAGDPVVPIIHAAMRLRHTARAKARRAVQFIRARKA
jgi:hypothetical protein